MLVIVTTLYIQGGVFFCLEKADKSSKFKIVPVCNDTFQISRLSEFSLSLSSPVENRTIQGCAIGGVCLPGAGLTNLCKSKRDKFIIHRIERMCQWMIFFRIFYIMVQHVKNIFPKFQINGSKILGEIFEIFSYSDSYGSPFVLNAFFSKLYFWSRSTRF